MPIIKCNNCTTAVRIKGLAHGNRFGCPNCGHHGVLRLLTSAATKAKPQELRVQIDREDLPSVNIEGSIGLLTSCLLAGLSVFLSAPKVGFFGVVLVAAIYAPFVAIYAFLRTFCLRAAFSMASLKAVSPPYRRAVPVEFILAGVASLTLLPVSFFFRSVDVSPLLMKALAAPLVFAISIPVYSYCHRIRLHQAATVTLFQWLVIFAVVLGIVTAFAILRIALL